MGIRAVIGLLKEAGQLWVARNAFQHAGALAFYTLISLAPLLIILVAIIGAVFGAEAARGEISGAIGDLIGPQAAEAVEDAVQRSRLDEAGLWPTVLGVCALMFGATTVFAQIQNSLNQFWGVVARPTRSGVLVFLTRRLLSLGTVLIIGFLLLTSLALSMAITAAIQYADDWIAVPKALVAVLDVTVLVLITTLLFGAIFKVLPDVRLRWSDVSRAGLLTAVLFVAGQSLISLYLTRTAPGSTYGAAGSLVVVLFWVYYSALILFFGAAVAKVAILRRDGHVTPKRGAVRIEHFIQEDNAR